MKTAIVILSTFLLVSCHIDNHSTYSLSSATQAIVQEEKETSDNESVHQMLAAYNEKNWSKVVEIGDQMVKGNIPLGCEVTLYAEGLAAVGRSQEAVPLLNDRIKREPENYYLVQTLGNIHMFNAEYASANKCFNRVIELNPRYASPYIYNGDILAMQGDYIGASDSYMHAIYLFAENGCWKECVEYSERIIDLYPLSDDYYRAYIFLAVANWRLGNMNQYEEARKMVELEGGTDGLMLLDELCENAKE